MSGFVYNWLTLFHFQCGHTKKIGCQQAIDPSFVTIPKPWSNKREETFCEWLKRMCKLFKINGQKAFKEPLIFSKSYKHFVKELA